AGASGGWGDLPTVHLRPAEASACIDAARLMMFRALAEAFETVARGDSLGMDVRLRNRRDQAFCVRLLVAAIDALFLAAGGQGLFLEQPLQRAWRDAHAAAPHMNERLHRALHLGAARGHDLGINEMGRPLPVWRPQLGNTLFHDADRLAHLFHADAVAVVTIAVLADRDVKIQLRIALVRLGLAQVPGGAGTAHHHARETPSPGVGERDYAEVHVALFEDAIVSTPTL